MYFDHRHPYSLCVNCLGKRFVNECCSYHRFGQAMIADQLSDRCQSSLLDDLRLEVPSPVSAADRSCPMACCPERRIPSDWWDSYIFEVDSLQSLGRSIDVPPKILMVTVALLNDFAISGQDYDFGRGNAAYDRYFGNPDVKPNPCLGPLDTGPYYAVKIELGELGTKGVLRSDYVARLMTKDCTVFDYLYAIGYCAVSSLGDCYPGAGGTLRPVLF